MPTYSGTTQPTVAALVVGSGRPIVPQTTGSVDIGGQVRATQYVLGNPVSGSSMTYGAVSANQLLPPPTFHVGTGALTLGSVTASTSANAPASMCVDASGRYVYASYSSGSTVETFSVNQSSGQLTSVGTSSAVDAPTSGGGGNGIAVDPSGRFAYVSTYPSSLANIRSFTINQTTGLLTSVGTQVVGVTNDILYDLACDPTGRFVFWVKQASGNGNGSLYYALIDQSTGLLGTAVYQGLIGVAAARLAIDPLGRYLIVMFQTPTYLVQAFSINQVTGALTQAGSSVTTGATSDPSALTIDRTGRFAWVVNWTTNTIYTYSVNQSTFALTFVSSTSSSYLRPTFIVADQTGRYLFVAHYLAANNQNISTWAINQATGTPSLLGSLDTGPSVSGIVGDTTGRFLFFSNSADNQLETYRINAFGASSGTFADGITIGSGRNASPQVALDVGGQTRSGQYLLGNQLSGTSLTYGASTANQLLAPPMFQGGSGALTFVGNATTGTSPDGVCTDPSGRWVFVTSSASDTVRSYAVDQSTGALTVLGNPVATTGGSTPAGIACDPTGRFVLLVTANSPTVQSFTINQSTGLLTQVGAVAAGTYANGYGPIGVTIHPNGLVALVTNKGQGQVISYQINQSTGALTQTGTVAAGNGSQYPIHVAIEPSGRFAYVTRDTTSVETFRINPATGTLRTKGSTTTGFAPNGVTCDPTGRFAYVANTNQGTVSTYSINQTTGLLTNLNLTVSVGTQNYSLTCDPTGKFLYAGNGGTDLVHAFSINQTTGGPTLAGTVATASGPRRVAVDPTGRFVYATCYAGNVVQAFRISNFGANSGSFKDRLTVGASGDSQLGVSVLRGTTTSASTVLLTADAAVASATNHTVIADNRVFGFRLDLIANSGAVGTSGTTYGLFGGQWTITGLARRATGVGTTTIIGTPYVTANADASLQAVTVAVAAETVTYGSLQVTVGGLAATNIHWVGQIQTTEVG